MTHLPHGHDFARKGTWTGAADRVILSYEDRFLRRKVLVGESGESFLVDLAHTESLDHGDAFRLSDGRLIEVVAAEEPLLSVTGEALPRIAWHIGNRHTPCQIEDTRLLILRDHVIRDMLEKIGATVTEVIEPFTPEGGAYGHGRTHGHDHSHVHSPVDHDAHVHSHEGEHHHGHSHDHGQSHGHGDGHSHGHSHTHGDKAHTHPHDH